MSQQVLIIETETESLRAACVGWTYEDSNLFIRNKPIGYTPSRTKYTPKTVLEALADGWKLLSPPICSTYHFKHSDHTYYSWWLVKD